MKSVYDNLDNYVVQKIEFSGYVYRMFDFDNTQFVLARNMIIDSQNNTLIVGFLCNYDNANEYTDNTWIEIQGIISKGDYHGEIPIIEVTSIKKINKPETEFVYPPDSSYIPTSILF